MKNMYRYLILVAAAACLTQLSAWEPAENTMLSPWGEEVTPDNVWTEYPRPQMVRDDWTNLNGLWNYKVTGRGAAVPSEWDGEILVPFALETPLSGIGKRLTTEEALWYQTTFKISESEDRTILHFEGVDYDCIVWVNGTMVGSHRGGNLPFSFDVTSALESGENELMLRVIDDTDAFDRYQPRGKQRQDNTGIWYTPSSGIWHTVWLETVPNSYLKDIKLLANMDGRLDVSAAIGGPKSKAYQLKVVLDTGEDQIKVSRPLAEGVVLHYSDAELWSPENPKLYDVTVHLLDESGAVLDSVDSYVGFRSVGKVQDADGHWQISLNGKAYFQLGPLDQGWWPGSFLSPPADEAIVFEMEYLKAAGFNMIRKHKKVEPRRYYYHADKIGLVIWQDQTSAGAGPNEWPKWKKLRADEEGYEPRNPNWWSEPGQKLDADWPDWAHEIYMAELKTMIDTLYNHPSVIMWTTFNERWGQHRSIEVGRWVEEYDPSRLLNISSGGNFFEVGQIADEHNYPDPYFPLAEPLFDEYIKVIGEFGGHGWPVEGHLWDPDMRNWGYGGLPKTIDEYKERYIRTSNMLGDFRKKGIAAGVYTQTTDVEGELNGLITYDRKVKKLSTEELHEIHKEAGLLP